MVGTAFAARRASIRQSRRSGGILSKSIYVPVDFFAHVSAMSTLKADKIFATYATYLVAGFCSQSGAERTNKYMVEVQGRKKATNLNLEKASYLLYLLTD